MFGSALLTWLSPMNDEVLMLALEDLARHGELVQWRDLPVTAQRAPVTVRAMLLRVLKARSDAPLRFWLGCALECFWFYANARLDLERITDELEYWTAQHVLLAADEGQLVTAARARTGELVLAIATATRLGYKVSATSTATKKLGMTLVDLVPALWQALTELDPTFDSERDAVANHIRNRPWSDYDWGMR